MNSSFSFKKFLEKKNILNSDNLEEKIKYEKLLKLKNKILPMKFLYPSKCYYCKSFYLVWDIENIFCSEDCKTMYNNFLCNEKKLSLFQYHYTLLKKK